MTVLEGPVSGWVAMKPDSARARCLVALAKYGPMHTRLLLHRAGTDSGAALVHLRELGLAARERTGPWTITETGRQAARCLREAAHQHRANEVVRATSTPTGWWPRSPEAVRVPFSHSYEDEPA